MGLVNLQGQTALVTGAGKRVGRAIALALAVEGVNVAVHYSRSATEAEQTAAEIATQGVQSWTVQADFGQPQGAVGLVGRVLELAGALDLVINSAGTFLPHRLDEVTWEGYLAEFAVNAWAPFVISREFAEQVGRGCVVNFLDCRIHGHSVAHVSYLWTKQLLAEMTTMLALRYAPQVRVNGVAPGLILAPPDEDDSALDRLVGQVPLKRRGEVEDLVSATLFLVKNDYFTGQVLYVDGGWHLK